MRWIQVICFLFITLSVQGQSDEVKDAFAKANQAYTAENYEIAIANYDLIIKSGMHSVETYFNLANAHYKLNHVGPAIYYYEKALQLDPNNKDVIGNLQFAKQMRIDAIEPLPENKLKSTFIKASKALSIDQWAYCSIILVILVVLFFVLYHYAQETGKKRVFFILMIVAGIAAIMSITSGFYAKNNLESNQYAIVFAEEFISREEPKTTSASSFTIHEGTKVKVIEEFNDWARISLENGSKAWVTLESIKKL